jgi:hypothetical protein
MEFSRSVEIDVRGTGMVFYFTEQKLSVQAGMELAKRASNSGSEPEEATSVALVFCGGAHEPSVVGAGVAIRLGTTLPCIVLRCEALSVDSGERFSPHSAALVTFAGPSSVVTVPRQFGMKGGTAADLSYVVRAALPRGVEGMKLLVFTTLTPRKLSDALYARRIGDSMAALKERGVRAVEFLSLNDGKSACCSNVADIWYNLSPGYSGSALGLLVEGCNCLHWRSSSESTDEQRSAIAVLRRDGRNLDS